MFSRQQRKDRRRGYSFSGHWRRVVETKGLRHVLLSVGGTLIIAGGALAYCSGGSSITGPPPPKALRNATSAPAPVPGGPQASLLPDPEEVEFPPLEDETPMPFANPCTGEAITGTLKRKEHFKFNKNTTHLSVHTKMQFDGEGLPRPDGSKTKYNGQGEDYFGFNVHEKGGEQTHVTTIIVNAKNSITGEREDDFRMHITEHVTFKLPGGPPGSSVNHMRAECK